MSPVVTEAPVREVPESSKLSLGPPTPSATTSTSPTIQAQTTQTNGEYEGIEKLGAENVPDAIELDGGADPAAEEPETEESKQRADRLRFLLEKSSVFAQLIGERMQAQRTQKAQADIRAAARKEKKEKEAPAPPPVRASARGGKAVKGGVKAEEAAPPPPVAGSKRKRVAAAKQEEGVKAEEVKPEEEDVEMADVDVKPELNGNGNAGAGPSTPTTAAKQEADSKPNEDDLGKSYIGQQPDLITGATLRDYQLAGVQWMVSLYENGLNGILADEMGLGKTIQTISFLAHLMSKGTHGPFLIVCPLSVLANWVNEFAKFAPTINVLMYHGSPQERAQMREEQMTGFGGGGGGSGMKKGVKTTKPTFPVIVTTYDMVMRDQRYLSKFSWKYIVVDEGHRLKNLDCKLIRELKTYQTANRLLLTGTPLHNNLAELWSLLNFILPDIFDDLETFQQWFDFDEVNQNKDNKMFDRQDVVTKLHDILKPFLLRRLKVDVEPNLPPKKEYLLYAPLTQQQTDLYKAVVTRNIRDYLIDLKSGLGTPATETPTATPTPTEDLSSDESSKRTSRRLAKKPKLNYEIDLDDDKFAMDVENGVPIKEQFVRPEESAEDLGKKWAIRQATTSVNNMKLQNIVMQLRKVSSHPFLFDWPRNEMTGEYVVNEDLVNASGKMLLLNRLLDALFAKGHKVLLFSQFTTMLDVIEDWATEYKKLKVFRIDGSTKQIDRITQMNEFNKGGDKPDACNLFLLSTRAGGLGINLVASDTVIFFDQDWNPQMDLQAADRAHRIGQTKPVLVFRLVSANTIEQKILQKASNKRKLEAMVIAKGKFQVVSEDGEISLLKKNKSKAAALSTAEWARQMMDFDAEDVTIATKDDRIISDEDLEILLDRSSQALAREKGWKAGVEKGVSDAKTMKKLKQGEKTAFEVFVPQDEGANDQLAHLFAEKEAAE